MVYEHKKKRTTPTISTPSVTSVPPPATATSTLPATLPLFPVLPFSSPSSTVTPFSATALSSLPAPYSMQQVFDACKVIVPCSDR